MALTTVMLLLFTLGVFAEHPATAVHGGPAVDETVVIDTSKPAGKLSQTSLVAGHAYLLRASGLYQNMDFGGLPKGRGAADVECNNFEPDGTYLRNRWFFLDPTGDFGDIYVNGRNLEWIANQPDAFGCSSDHRYSAVFVPDENGPAHFVPHEINDVSFVDNIGTITIRIQDAQTLLETFTLNAFVPGVDTVGTNSSTGLVAGSPYRLEVRGTYLPSTFPGLSGDGECIREFGSPGNRDLLTKVLLPGNTTDDFGDVYVYGRPVDWVPTIATPLGCNDTNNTYTYDFAAPQNGPVNVRIFDTWHADNGGSLELRLYSLPALPPSPPDPQGGGISTPRLKLAEELQLNSADPAGATTVVPLQAGRPVLIEAQGTYWWSRGFADAECSNADIDPTWLPGRFNDVVPGTDLLDVLIDGESVAWAATIPNQDGCNVVDHAYRFQFTPSTTHRVNFKMASVWYGANAGIVTIRVFHIEEIPIGVVDVPANSELGISSQPLLADHNYRFAASGIWSPWNANPAYLADAECSANATSGGFQPNLYASLNIAQDLHDVYVNNAAVVWGPRNTSSSPCDPLHQYSLSHAAETTAPVHFKIVDTPGGYGDNAGSVRVELFLRTD